MFFMLWWWFCSIVGCTTNGTFNRSSGSCPPASDLLPCTCDGPDRFLMLECNRITDDYSIVRAVSALTRTRLGKFSLLNSRITALESNVLGPAQFQYIYMRKNNLKEIRPQFFDSSRDSLIRLEIVHNDLEKFPFKELASFSKLEYVSLKYNALESVPDFAFGEEYNSKIRKIDLSFNKIKHVGSNAFKYLTRLEKLDLRYNKLTVVNNLAFSAAQANPKLMLDLSNNKIMFISDGAFENQVFKCLNLTDNNLTKLTESAFQELLARMADRSTGIIAVANNRFRCTCDKVRWLVELPNLYKLPILDLECIDRNGKSLQDLSIRELGC